MAEVVQDNERIPLIEPGEAQGIDTGVVEWAKNFAHNRLPQVFAAGALVVGSLSLHSEVNMPNGTCPIPAADPIKGAPSYVPERDNNGTEIVYEGNPDGPRVLFVGDSITRLASMPNILAQEGAVHGAIQERFSDEYQIHVEAQNGKTAREMTDELTRALEDPNGPPDAIVINLGTNNMIQDDPNTFADFDQLVEKIIASGVRCTILVTVNESTDEHKRKDYEAFAKSMGQKKLREDIRASEINKYLRNIAKKYRGFYVVDWNEDPMAEMGTNTPGPHYFSVVINPEEEPAKQIFLGDGTHQSTEGSIEMVFRINDVLYGCRIGQSC